MATVHTLGQGQGGYFEIDGYPYNRGSLFPVWVGTTLELRYSHLDGGGQPLPATDYTQLQNGITGVAFASFAELLQFFKDYCAKTVTALPRPVNRNSTSAVTPVGAGATAFPAAACRQMDIINSTGVDILYQVTKNAVTEPVFVTVFAGTTRMVVGITDASQVAVKSSAADARTVIAEIFS